jgi:mxaD protein
MLKAAACASVETTPDTLWSVIGSFGSVGAWHPMLKQVTADGEREGATRTARTSNGEEQVERLIEVRADERRYRYTMISTWLPVRNCVSDFRIHEADDGTSIVEWSSAFEVDGGDEKAVVQGVRDFLQAGLDNVSKIYG